MTTAVRRSVGSNERVERPVVTVHEIRNITTITTRDRNTGKVKTETLIGESPFGK